MQLCRAFLRAPQTSARLFISRLVLSLQLILANHPEKATLHLALKAKVSPSTPPQRFRAAKVWSVSFRGNRLLFLTRSAAAGEKYKDSKIKCKPPLGRFLGIDCG